MVLQRVESQVWRISLGVMDPDSGLMGVSIFSVTFLKQH